MFHLYKGGARALTRQACKRLVAPRRAALPSGTLSKAKTTRALRIANEAGSSSWREAGVSFATSVFGIGCSMAIGDMICQGLSNQGGYNRDRGLTMFVTGAFITGPISYTWQIVLERQVPGRAVAAIVQKTLMNSAYAFTISLPVMFTAVTLLSKAEDGRRKTWRDAVAKVKADLVPTFLAGCLYWPFFNFLTFRFIATRNRAMVGSLIGTVWNIYLASVANKTVSNVGDVHPVVTVERRLLRAEA